MTTLTVQLDETIAEQARSLAEFQETTLDAAVADAIEAAALRQGLIVGSLNTPESRLRRWSSFLAAFGTYDTGGPYTKDELNER